MIHFKQKKKKKNPQEVQSINLGYALIETPIFLIENLYLIY